MQVTLGKNIILYLVNDSSAVVRIGAARTVRRKAVREMKETSDSTTGRFKKYIAGMIDQTLSVQGLMGYSNGSQYDATDLYTKLVAVGTNLISFQYKVDNGTYVWTYSGQCIVSSFEESRQYNEAGSYDVELQVVGQITVTQTGTSVPYYWVTSPTALTAAQVVALIQAGSATSVTAPSYSTITINFLAPTGKYLYFAIPATSPDRLSYYVSVGDNGRVGQVGDLFTYVTQSITVGSLTANYKVYSTSISKTNNSPMDLRTFYPTSGGIIGYGTSQYQSATAAGGSNSITISLAAGVQLNKIILILRGGPPAELIIASPGVPTGSTLSWDATNGIVTCDSTNPFFAGEKITIIYLT